MSDLPASERPTTLLGSALERAAARLHYLRAASEALLTLQSLDELAPAALAHITRLSDLTWAGVILLDQRAGTARLIAAVGSAAPQLSPGAVAPLQAFGLSAGLPGRGEPQELGLGDPGLPPGLRALAEEGARACLHSPLLVAGELVGTLSVAVAEPASLGPELREILAEVASQIEVAIHQLRLQAARQDYASLLEERVEQRTAQLAHAVRELEAFSYSVSHDLRSPLRAIDGFSRILLQEHAEQMPPSAHHYLSRIRQNTQQMGALIDDLLRFSRLDRQALSLHPITMSPLIQQALEQLRPEQAGREIALQIAALPDCVGDPTLIRQVWLNLLSNALKYTRRRGQAVIQIGGHVAVGERIYFVRDNGVGFDMRYADKLFQVFQRLHPPGEYEGTGVGLAIVQRIIHRHGGRAWAEAAVDEGATFYFSL